MSGENKKYDIEEGEIEAGEIVESDKRKCSCDFWSITSPIFEALLSFVGILYFVGIIFDTIGRTKPQRIGISYWGLGFGMLVAVCVTICDIVCHIYLNARHQTVESNIRTIEDEEALGLHRDENTKRPGLTWPQRIAFVGGTLADILSNASGPYFMYQIIMTSFNQENSSTFPIWYNLVAEILATVWGTLAAVGEIRNHLNSMREANITHEVKVAKKSFRSLSAQTI